MNWVTDCFRKRMVVGMADMVVTNDSSAELVTYSLGSCLGVAIYDPVKRVGGLLHSMLPTSSLDKEKSLKFPYKFLDTGVPLLFHTAYRFGAEKSRLIVRVVGGASILDDYFHIGSRNYEKLQQILKSNGVLINAQEVGGKISRSVSLEIATGRLLIETPGRKTVSI